MSIYRQLRNNIASKIVKQESQFKIKIKIFLKPKCENGEEYSRIPRPNDARSQVRCGHDVNN